MSANSVFKLAGWGVIVIVVLSVIFYFVIQLVGPDSFLLSITLIVSVIIGILLLIGWNRLRRAIK